MRFMPGPDAELLRTSLRGFFAKASPEAEVRRWMELPHGFDAELWQRSAHELGIQGLVISEELGGAGASLVELGVAFEEMGRALVCAPFLSTLAFAVPLLGQLDNNPAAAAILAAIADGTAVATLAGGASGGVTVTDGQRISGTADIVVDGADADIVLGAATNRDGRIDLFAVPKTASGLSVEPLVTLDSTRRLARLRFEDVAGQPLASDIARMLDRVRDTAALLLAAEQLGGASRALEDAVLHASTRVQFGRPIGSFQAIKHRLADMLVDVESARSVVAHALYRVSEDAGALPLEAALARSVASDVYLATAAANLQIHGGIGFTWEHSAHLHLKRAKSSALLLGTATASRRRLAEHLKIASGT